MRGSHAVATVVRVEPPVSARVGDKAVVTAEGVLTGWDGGACSEPIVIREALDALAEGRPRLVRITPAEMAAASPPGVVAAISTCPSGGGLEVFVEPVGIAPLLLVVGDAPVAAALATLAGAVGYETARLGVADLERLGPDAAGPGDAVVVASMGHYDQEGLAAALRTEAGYVGMVGSRARAAAVFDALRRDGVADHDLARVASPAGLDLGPSTQQEIAVAILAELIRERHRRAAAPSIAVDRATDPVCGMAVARRGARFTLERDGETYWFCGEHCRLAFEREPGRYLRPAGTG